MQNVVAIADCMIGMYVHLLRLFGLTEQYMYIVKLVGLYRAARGYYRSGCLGIL